MSTLTKTQRVGVFIAAMFYIGAGAAHFLRPELYLQIMPPYLPWHVPLVMISGFFEILGGIGLLVPQVRRPAAWGLVALLIAVFPANIYMATNPIETGMDSMSAVIRWGRLPLQVVLVWWLLWCTRTRQVS